MNPAAPVTSTFTPCPITRRPSAVDSLWHGAEPGGRGVGAFWTLAVPLGLCSARDVQPSDGHRSVFPSASVVAPTLVELGPLRNGLGSLRNLELLLKSIKVGQKGLFAAVAAVHADCAAMIASLGSVSHALESRGTEPSVARHLSDA